MEQKIMLGFLVGLALISFVSAGPVSDFWVEKGLPFAQAQEIESGTATEETIANAEALQNPIEPEVNETIIEQAQGVEAKDIWFFIYAGLLGLMAVGSVVALIWMFMGWGNL